MKLLPIDEALCRRVTRRIPSPRVALLWLALGLAGPLACNQIEPSEEPTSGFSESQDLESDNGLSANGLSANGLSANGLSANGLSANGLSAASFNTWFNQNPTLNDTVMRYIVRCAVPANQVRTYKNPKTQITYSWQGELGLAPGWASGQPANLAEQQLVSACLAAHVNKFGVTVTLSVLGKDSTGQLIPFTWDELDTYSYKEGCFFGNLFNGEGVFYGAEGPPLPDNKSSSRACVLSSEDPTVTSQCPPLTYAGSCAQLCQPIVPGGFYVACTWHGVTYKPLTTRVRPSEIYTCGDHVCQVSETCSSSPGTGCEADCGRCADYQR
ncbi:MAG: hypothetical protein ACJ8AT_15095 [Hyalangium sp.]|uniref:hypothetical protein n=1 Tax=Hyalangium sp. TaxID=2028555 RepID=UPI003899C796